MDFFVADNLQEHQQQLLDMDLTQAPDFLVRARTRRVWSSQFNITSIVFWIHINMDFSHSICGPHLHNKRNVYTFRYVVFATYVGNRNNCCVALCECVWYRENTQFVSSTPNFRIFPWFVMEDPSLIIKHAVVGICIRSYIIIGNEYCTSVAHTCIMAVGSLFRTSECMIACTYICVDLDYNHDDTIRTPRTTSEGSLLSSSATKRFHWIIDCMHKTCFRECMASSSERLVSRIIRALSDVWIRCNTDMWYCLFSVLDGRFWATFFARNKGVIYWLLELALLYTSKVLYFHSISLDNRKPENQCIFERIHSFKTAISVRNKAKRDKRISYSFRVHDNYCATTLIKHSQQQSCGFVVYNNSMYLLLCVYCI